MVPTTKTVAKKKMTLTLHTVLFNAFPTLRLSRYTSDVIDIDLGLVFPGGAVKDKLLNKHCVDMVKASINTPYTKNGGV